MVDQCSPKLVKSALVIYENLSWIPNIRVVVVVVTFIIYIATMMHFVAIHTRLVHFSQIIFYLGHEFALLNLGDHLLGLVYFWKNSKLNLIGKFSLHILHFVGDNIHGLF